jgi:hypothetical protein
MLGLVLLVLGAGMTATGVVRARGPWAQYQSLKAQEDNIARYESWRGGLRDSGPTGASVAMDLYRRRARDGAILAGVGLVVAIVGLFQL